MKGTAVQIKMNEFLLSFLIEKNVCLNQLSCSLPNIVESIFPGSVEKLRQSNPTNDKSYLKVDHIKGEILFWLLFGQNLLKSSLHKYKAGPPKETSFTPRSWSSGIADHAHDDHAPFNCGNSSNFLYLCITFKNNNNWKQ